MKIVSRFKQLVGDSRLEQGQPSKVDGRITKLPPLLKNFGVNRHRLADYIDEGVWLQAQSIRRDGREEIEDNVN